MGSIHPNVNGVQLHPRRLTSIGTTGLEELSCTAWWATMWSSAFSREGPAGRTSAASDVAESLTDSSGGLTRSPMTSARLPSGRW